MCVISFIIFTETNIPKCTVQIFSLQFTFQVFSSFSFLHFFFLYSLSSSSQICMTRKKMKHSMKNFRQRWQFLLIKFLLKHHKFFFTVNHHQVNLPRILNFYHFHFSLLWLHNIILIRTKDTKKKEYNIGIMMMASGNKYSSLGEEKKTKIVKCYWNMSLLGSKSH